MVAVTAVATVTTVTAVTTVPQCLSCPVLIIPSAQFDEYLYVGMSSCDSQEFVAGQLLLLHDHINLLYGPVTSMLKPANSEQKEARWKSIANLMRVCSTVRHPV